MHEVPMRDRQGGWSGSDPADGPVAAPHQVAGRPRGRPPRTPASRGRRIARALVLVLVLLVTASVASYVWAGTQLNRTVDLGKVPDRPPRGKGTNYLIVGSDSRQGLTGRAKRELHTGSADGGRTDSMILLHTGAHGTTTVSLPRDSWLTVPAHVRPETGEHVPAAKDKLNASYALGGPDLLVRTVEYNTGLHIDHYAEIGFSGFVDVVNAVGGVRMCLDRDIRDKNSGLALTKGCHVLDGRTALAFVRQRHQEARGDLGRTMNQQKFLSALAHRAAAPGVALDPFKAYPTVRSGLHTLVVDKDTTPWTLAALFRAMRNEAAGGGRRLDVPVSDLGLSTPKGSAVQWNAARAKRLFEDLREDRTVHAG
ncbi:transcriptional regulator [Streptomyces sulfonofaciens]|uniref:Transcriptional regulator n=1 Tax=Streptomyces sulfonofaciens TaxID=68272 RepID=A0A919G9V3_9ACTN|nr:LCP family protein [Streptomyces sulfonofaciens]GHH80223.1 transcriptional regulator [Streptomyces sulfonofaciens]